MEWLSQNWLWIAVAVGGFFLFTRMGGMGGCGMGHSGNHRRDQDVKENVPPAAGNRPGNLFDPVSRHAFAAGNMPFSTVYRGRAYYFESRENRDAFEADPDKHLVGTASAGEVIESDRDVDHRPRRRHGC